jgi:DNA polymerase-4/DNA polymerase IV (DinB-like DNA polymerase)
VRDIQTRQDEVIRLLGRQGQWIVQQALGKDDRKVVAYRPEEAKSISRELTFQEDVEDFDFLKDVLVLLSLSVEKRAERVGLYGEGVHLKITYSDMKTITRSRLTASTRSAAAIMREAAGLLEQVQKRPVRLIGVGIYHMTGEMYRQVHFDDLLRESSMENQDPLQEDLERLHRRYGLDFAGNLDKIFHGETLYKTVEYMRKHK